MYVCMYVCRYVSDCLWENNTKNLYAKMRGRDYVVQTRACSKQFWDFESKCRLELLLGNLNSTIIKSVKTDL